MHAFYKVIFSFYDNHYVPVVLSNHHIDIRRDHVCAAKSRVTLTCVDVYGKLYDTM